MLSVDVLAYDVLVGQISSHFLQWGGGSWCLNPAWRRLREEAVIPWMIRFSSVELGGVGGAAAVVPGAGWRGGKDP